MFCSNCGAEVVGKFCANCGAPIAVVDTAAPPQSVVVPPTMEDDSSKLKGLPGSSVEFSGDSVSIKKGLLSKPLVFPKLQISEIVISPGKGFDAAFLFVKRTGDTASVMNAKEAEKHPAAIIFPALSFKKFDSAARSFGVPVYSLDDKLRELEASGVAYCPKCHSTSLSSNKKGFGIGKAVVGAALTGGIGLVAGNFGAKKVRVTCLKCGHEFWAGKG